MASRGAIDGRWAAGAALDLARAWSAEGRRVILIDAGLTAPSLHDAARIRNREGLADAVLHGASVSRVSRSVDGGSLFLVTAGAPVVDPGDVARAARWQRLVAGMVEAGVTVLLFVHDDDASTPAFLGAVSDIVVLAGAEERDLVSIRDLEPLVRRVLGAKRDMGASPADHTEAPPPLVVGEGIGVGSAWIVALVVIAAVAIAALGLALMSGGG